MNLAKVRHSVYHYLMKYNILLVEDDEDFGFMLKQYLELSGLEVRLIAHPQEAEALLDQDFTFHLAILDVMMPYMSGFTLAQKILSRYPGFPFIFLTAKDQKIDKLTGLKIGADDYITKPCDPEELVLRIQNIVRRSQPVLPVAEVRIGTYVFDRSNFLLIHPLETFRLTEREVNLLSYLWSQNRQLVTREQILEQVWGTTDFFTGRSMDVFISRLRKYLSHDPGLQINSVRGIGFDVRL